MGTVMNPHGSVGILNGCEIKRKRVKHVINVIHQNFREFKRFSARRLNEEYLNKK